MATQEQTSGLQQLLNGTTDSYTLTGVNSGSLLVLACANWRNVSNDVPTVSDDNSNTWNSGPAQTVDGSGSKQHMRMFYVENANSGDTVVTVDPGNNSYLAWAVVEWSGMETSSSLDDSGTNSSTTGDANVTQSGASSQDDTVTFAAMSQSSDDTDIASSLSGYTNIATQDNSPDVAINFGYKVNTTAATESASWAHDNVTQYGWGAVIGTFKQTAAGGGSGPNLLTLLGVG